MKSSIRLDKAREATAKKYSRQHVAIDDHHYRLNVVRTPSAMLNYKLGIGGFPYGHAVEVFGANQIGKSSSIGYGTLGNVQRDLDERGEPKIPAVILTEPRLTTPEDREWALKLGFDPDMALLQYPDHVEEAFDMLRDLVFGNLVDYIMVDSLGGMGTPSGAKEGGNKKAYGISGDVTAGLNDIMPRLYKNNIGLLIINQQRQGTGGAPGITWFESPGGEALHHHMRIRIHVKPGKDKWTADIDGEKVVVGRRLKCVIKKNNMTQGAEKSAEFNFWNIDTQEHSVGIDVAQDVIDTSMIAGVMTKDSGHYYYHSIFPDGRLRGKPGVSAFLHENPSAYEKIYQELMQVMLNNELEAAKEKRSAENKIVARKEDEEDGS